MYKKMLVPLDGSELAEVALPYAEELAGRLGSEVTLIHVMAPTEDPSHPFYQDYLRKMVGTTSHGIERFLEKSKGKVTKVESAIVGSRIAGSGILVDHSADEIVDYADKENVGLIVMATHGRSGIKRWALGSVADKVVKAAKQPVMLVRANGARPDVRETGILNKVLVPLDGSKEGEAAIPYIKELASKFKAEVILLHVVAQPYNVYAGSKGLVEVPYTEEEKKWQTASAEDYLREVTSRLKDEGVTTRYEVRMGSAAEEIIKLADEIHADVVAMAAHGRSGFTRWEHGSVTDKVLHAGNTPLLLVREAIVRQGKTAWETIAEPETIDLLIGNLASSDGVTRVKARRSLVAMGRQVVGPVVEALKSKKHWVRWEAAKTLAQIGDPTATQALIDALEDVEFDVRWLAAEGLIHIGGKAIEPLLKVLTERFDSVWLREGAHHVLHDVDKGDLDDTLRPVISALEDIEPSIEIPFVLEKALGEITGNRKIE